MTYYESMAKMAVIANKKTNFLAHLLHRMEFDTEKKILYVDVSPMIKRDILKAIGAESKNPLILASQYLSELQKADLIKSMGGGRYTVDPMSFGYAKYVPKDLREKASKIYQMDIFHVDGEKHTETWVVDSYGEEHQL